MGQNEIKNKNLQKIGQESLLDITLKQAKKIKNINKIFLSTDSKKIAAAAKKHDIEIIMRPKNLSRDKSSEWFAWQHAIKHVNKKFKFDKFICLPVTSPLRSKIDIENCIKELNNNYDIVITIQETNRNPWFNMVKIGNKKRMEIINKSINKTIDTRHRAPKVYDMTTVCYVAVPNYILENKSIFSGRVGAIMVPQQRALDIDTPFDLKLARLLYPKT